MVKWSEFVDLDLEPGDILSVKGLEVIDQNIERYIHLARQLGSKKAGLRVSWN